MNSLMDKARALVRQQQEDPADDNVKVEVKEEEVEFTPPSAAPSSAHEDAS